MEAHRTRGRTASRVAGSDAARHLRPRPPAGPGGKLHPVLRAQGRAGQDHRPEPPVPGRQQRHRLDAGGAQSRARARRRLLADSRQRQELLDGFLRPESAAQAGRQLDLRGRHRPRGAGRADRHDLQDHRRGKRSRGPSVPRHQWCPPARAAARQPPLRVHPGAQVPDARRAVRPLRRDRADRRGPPQPVRHAGAEHARRAAQGHVPGVHRHAADRGRGTHQGSLR